MYDLDYLINHNYNINIKIMLSLTERIKHRSFITPNAVKLSKSLPDLNYNVFQIPGTRSYDSINYYKLWAQYGIFFDYLLRRDISILIGQKIYDDSAIELAKPRDYALFKDDTRKSSDIMGTIWRVSYSHTLHWILKRNKDYDMKDFWLEVPEIESIFNLMDITDISGVSYWVCSIMLERYGLLNIISNPDFFNIAGFCAEGDILIGDCMIDFKTSKYEASNNLDYSIQLLSYAGLARLSGYTINRIAFVNPLLGRISEMDISKWDNHEDLIEAISNIEINN